MDGSIPAPTITLEAGPLRKALQLIKPACPQRYTMPPRLDVTDLHGRLALTGRDLLELEITIATDAPYSPFPTALPHKELSGLLRPCAPLDAVKISPAPGGTVKIDLPDLTAQLGPNQTECPDRLKDVHPAGASATIDAVPLAKAFELVSGAMSVEETRYYLNGVYVEPRASDETALTFVATDGHRLVSHTVTGLRHNLTAGIILPRAAVHALRPILAAHSTSTLSLTMHGECAVNIASDSFELVTKLIDGKFPDYNRVIPKDVPPAATMAAAPLQRFLMRVGALGPSIGNAVSIGMRKGEDKIELRWAQSDVGTLSTTIDGSCERTLEIGFQRRYLGHMLQVLKSPQITLYAQDAASPAIFTGAAELADPLTTIVLMPMRI